MKGGDENDGEVEWEKNSIFLCREKCINYANILFFLPQQKMKNVILFYINFFQKQHFNENESWR